MTTESSNGPQALVDRGIPVLRIMRFMPVSIPVPLRIELRVGTVARLVLPGVRMTVGGALEVGGFGARLTYQQRGRKSTTPDTEVHSEGVAYPGTRAQTILPRAFERPAPEDPPEFWIQFLDGEGSGLTPPTRLGRCDRGPYNLCPNLSLGLLVDAAIVKCVPSTSDSRAMLAVGGEIRIRSGIVARLSLVERRYELQPASEATPQVDVMVFPAGTVVRLPLRDLPGRLERESCVLLTFLDGAGRAIGSEWLLGKAHTDIRQASTGGSDASSMASTRHQWRPLASKKAHGEPDL